MAVSAGQQGIPESAATFAQDAGGLLSSFYDPSFTSFEIPPGLRKARRRRKIRTSSLRTCMMAVDGSNWAGVRTAQSIQGRLEFYRISTRARDELMSADQSTAGETKKRSTTQHLIKGESSSRGGELLGLAGRK